MTVHDRVVDELKRNPGSTALEVAQALFGSSAYQQRVNGACLWLTLNGEAVREGRGGRADPYRHTLIA